MSDPDFSELDGGETSSSSSDTERRDATEFSQVHIKARWGTTTIKNTQGCRVCGKNGDAVLLTNVVEGEVEPEFDQAIVVCDRHEGDVRGDLKYGPNLVQRRDF